MGLFSGSTQRDKALVSFCKRDLSLMFDGILNATLSEEHVFNTGVTQELKRVTNSRAIAQKSWILIESINMVIITDSPTQNPIDSISYFLNFFGTI